MDLIVSTVLLCVRWSGPVYQFKNTGKINTFSGKTFFLWGLITEMWYGSSWVICNFTLHVYILQIILSLPPSSKFRETEFNNIQGVHILSFLPADLQILSGWSLAAGGRSETSTHLQNRKRTHPHATSNFIHTCICISSLLTAVKTLKGAFLHICFPVEFLMTCNLNDCVFLLFLLC